MALIPGVVGSYGGWVIALVVAVFTFTNQSRKTDVDESAMVLDKWKQLVEQHQSDIKGIRDEFNEYKKATALEKVASIAEITDVRDRLRAAEYRMGEQDKEIAGLKSENAGLRRSIAQNSQSTAYQLGRRDAATAASDADFTDRLDRAGHNSREDDT